MNPYSEQIINIWYTITVLTSSYQKHERHSPPAAAAASTCCIFRSPKPSIKQPVSICSLAFMPKYLTISALLSPQTSAPTQAHPTSPLHPLNRLHRDHLFHLFTANAADIPPLPALPLPKQSPATYCPLGSSSVPNPPAATSILTGTPISDATTLPSTSPRRSSFFAPLKAVIARVTRLVEVKAAVLVHAKIRWKSTFALFIKRASKRNNTTHMRRMTRSLSKLKTKNDKNKKRQKKTTRRSSTLLACFRSPMVRNWSHTFMAIMAIMKFLELRYPFIGIRFWFQERADNVSCASSWRTGS
jgi:hypothetical protein